MGVWIRVFIALLSKEADACIYSFTFSWVDAFTVFIILVSSGRVFIALFSSERADAFLVF